MPGKSEDRSRGPTELPHRLKRQRGVVWDVDHRGGLQEKVAIRWTILSSNASPQNIFEQVYAWVLRVRPPLREACARACELVVGWRERHCVLHSQVGINT